jgi:hypothetical protein
MLQPTSAPNYRNTYKLIDPNDVTFNDLNQRIVEAGQRGKPLTYAQLAAGLTFHLRNGTAHQIQDSEWVGIGGALMGECLGIISEESLQQHGFMASALVVRQDTERPSEGFFELAQQLGVMAPNEDRRIVWSVQRGKAYDLYQQNPLPPNLYRTRP